MEYLKILQLPQAEEQFRLKGEEIAKVVERCQNMVVTEDNYKDIKKTRADLRKEAYITADEFKEVKQEVLRPWATVEQAYNQYIRDNYRDADLALKQKINAVEDALKEAKEAKIRKFFEEYATSESVPVGFNDAKINITLSASEKLLKAECRTFVDQVKYDLEMIAGRPNADEVRAEYVLDYNLGRAIVAVDKRKEAEKRLREIAEDALAQELLDREAETKVEKIVSEEILTARFEVRAARDKLKMLSKFLQEKGFDYKNITED